jgi:hypothetical protein
MSFATQGTFAIDRCLRVLDWEPYQVRRRLQPEAKFDALYPPSPDLPKEIIETVQTIIRACPERYVIRAMHYFRQGVIETELMDQFLQFWTVLEVIAEGSKKTERVPLRSRFAARTSRLCTPAASASHSNIGG